MRNWTNDKRRREAVCGLALSLACCVVPSASIACEASRWTVAKSELLAPLDLRPDGSFVALVKASREPDPDGTYPAENIEGGPIQDLGNGRIGQKITSGDGCDVYEKLLFVDCNAMEGILMSGQSVELWVSGGTYQSIAEIQYPKGPIGFTKDTTVAKVEAIAKKHDIHVTRELYAHYSYMAEKKRYNPYQGCKIFYPDSPGAKR